MIENIIKSLQESIGEDLIGKVGLTKNQADKVISESTNIAQNELKNQAASGAIDAIKNLFSPQSNTKAADSIQNNLVSNLVNSYTKKLGLSKSQSDMIVDMILPKILSFFGGSQSSSGKVSSSPLENILEMVGGDSKSKSNPLGKLIGGFFKK